MCFPDLSIRALVLLSVAVVLSACSVVPGQRMITPPTVVETGGEYSPEPQKDLPVPITDINLDLIRKMKTDADGDQPSQEVMSLIGPADDPYRTGQSGFSYRIGRGDVLQITVWDHPELAAALGQSMETTRAPDPAPGFVVDDEGNIHFPYAGSIKAVGRTTEDIQKRVRDALKKTFKDPEVTVRVASFRAGQIYIDGEVHTPGDLQINDIPMSLAEAVSRAGGFTSNADESRVDLTRNGKTIRIDLPKLIRSGHNPSDILLKPHDIVRIAARDENGVYVMGEVNRPATITPMKDGRLTLSEAISQAGSLNPNTAEAKQLYVIRGYDVSHDTPAANFQVYHLDATSPVSMLLANQFQLRSKDIVYVDNGALVKFNRVLNMLLPAINAGLTTAILTK